MWKLLDRTSEVVADLTIGTVIVVVHAALARREDRRASRPEMLEHPSSTYWRFADVAGGSSSWSSSP
jgi:hypothetical protein